MKPSVIYILLAVAIEQGASRQVWRLTSMQDERPSNVFKSVNSNSVSDCAEKCTRNCGCVAFRFHTVYYYCYYYSKMVFASQDARDKANQTYYWPLTELNACEAQPGYILDTNRNICYRVFHVKQPWETALAVCAAEGGHLLIADTRWRRQLVNDLLPGKKVYVGAKGNSGQIFWSDGRRLQASDFLLENGYLEDPGCLLVSDHKELFLSGCNTSNPFICEKPLVE